MGPILSGLMRRKRGPAEAAQTDSSLHGMTYENGVSFFDGGTTHDTAVSSPLEKNRRASYHMKPRLSSEPTGEEKDRNQIYSVALHQL